MPTGFKVNIFRPGCLRLSILFNNWKPIGEENYDLSFGCRNSQLSVGDNDNTPHSEKQPLKFVFDTVNFKLVIVRFFSPEKELIGAH